jgi:hypothetical protein
MDGKGFTDQVIAVILSLWAEFWRCSWGIHQVSSKFTWNSVGVKGRFQMILRRGLLHYSFLESSSIPVIYLCCNNYAHIYISPTPLMSVIHVCHAPFLLLYLPSHHLILLRISLLMFSGSAHALLQVSGRHQG